MSVFIGLFLGYGFIAPVTETGRVMCIFYSIFGIPLTMLALANLGLRFASQVRKVQTTLLKLNCGNSNSRSQVEVTSVDIRNRGLE